MAASQGELLEENCRNSGSSQPYQRVAERVQQWNRAIPEAGYITLGTIRYGVRLSNVHPLSGATTPTATLTNSMIEPGSCCGNSSISVNTACGSNSSNRSTGSTTFNSCCCIGSSGIVLPWNANYARTKLPVPTSTAAKNRTLSTSQSSSFSLAMSAPPPPPPPLPPPPPSPLSSSTSSSVSAVQPIHLPLVAISSPSNTSSNAYLYQKTSKLKSAKQASSDYLPSLQRNVPSIAGNTNTTLASSAIPTNITSSLIQSSSSSSLSFIPETVPQHQQKTKTTTTDEMVKIASTAATPMALRTNTNTLKKNISSGGSSSILSKNSQIRRTRSSGGFSSASAASASHCELNSDSVLVEQCRELSISPIPHKLSSSICCYTIANSSKIISKQSNRTNQKRIPRSTIIQHNQKNPAILLTAISSGPPIPPPKTKIADYCEDRSIDPINFHRKIQQFETRTHIEQQQQHQKTSISGGNNNNNNNNQTNNNNSNIESGISRFGLINCFSGGSGNAPDDYSDRENSDSNSCSTSSIISGGGNITNDNCAILNNLRKCDNINNTLLFSESIIHNSDNIDNNDDDSRHKIVSSKFPYFNIKTTNNQDTIVSNGHNNCNNKVTNIINLNTCNDQSIIKFRSLTDSSSSTTTISSTSSSSAPSAATVVIRKLTPKLTKKSYHHNRGDSEDRLIDKLDIDNLKCLPPSQIINANKINNRIVSNDIDEKNLVDNNNLNNNDDDNDDIGFIDSSAGDGEHISSLSDIDFISNDIYNNENPIQEIDLNATTSSSSIRTIKNSKSINTNSYNLLYDSVPNNNNNNNINNSNNKYNRLNADDNNINVENQASSITCLTNSDNCCCSSSNSRSCNNFCCCASGCSISNNSICGCCNNNNNNNNLKNDLCVVATIDHDQDDDDNIRINIASSAIANLNDRVDHFSESELISNNRTTIITAATGSCNSVSISNSAKPPINNKNSNNNNNNNNNNSVLTSASEGLDYRNLKKSDLPPIPSSLPPTIPEVQQSTSGSAGVKTSYTINRKLVPSESFGYFTRHHLYATTQPEKGVIMEKRRNTLDRFQRLAFGRKSTPSPTPQENKSNSRKTDKSERLKELTELLKGNRSSPTPPPIPPPRRPRQSSLEKPLDSAPILSSQVNSDDFIPMDAEDEQYNIPEVVNRRSDDISHRTDSHIISGGVAGTPMGPHKSTSLYQSLKPNTSVSNLENLIMNRDYRDLSKSPPKYPALHEDEMFTSKLPRAESRTIVGSYMQKTIPFRSASFSQVDYSSGKYIKSAVAAIRDRLRKDKESSVVDNANLTLPRKKDDIRSSSPRLEQARAEMEDELNALKKTEIIISLKYDPDNERLSLGEIVNTPDIILEEEPQLSESDRTYDETDSALNTPDIDRANIELESWTRNENNTNPISLKFVNESEPTLATLTEEDIPTMESPPETIMQTATTCLIPVPVYECVVGELETENPVAQWVDVAQDEVGLSPEIIEHHQEEHIESLVDLKTDDSKDELSSPEITSTTTSNLTPLSCDQVPIISVSQDSLSAHESVSDDNKPIEFIEVKKRYSNDEQKNGEKSSNSNESSLSRGGSCDEKRRIDKSRRRKGMYIQWPSIDRHGNIDSDWSTEQDIQTPDDLPPKNPTLDLTKVNFSALKGNTEQDIIDPAILFLNYSDSRTPGSQTSYDPSTPESECNRPIWPKLPPRRTSLTCQSSEEKDDPPSTASPCQRAHRNLMFMRCDSTSDNESDRNQPSRDRTSPSPAPGEQDFKRYSKRPLRGPYGQMLEAEMKKPAKLHYDELLDDLKSAESLNSLSPASRICDIGNRSFDESSISSTSPQSSKSSRQKKQPTVYLPIPMHTRAASTPSQIENTTTMASIDTINPQHKRYQSNLDNASMEYLRGKEPKKFSLDHIRDRSPKRTSSSDDHSKQHPKRSSSTASDKHPKRSLDEMRLSQSSRTPSERSVAQVSSSDSGKGNLMPTPELLAQLLKGSSERLVSEQRQQMFADTRTHVVEEIFRNEQSYVESLQTVVVKYFNILKTPEYAGMIDSKTVDEIFFMVPEILSIHQRFLNELRMRLDEWDAQQKVGDAFVETFSKVEVLDTYTSFVNNCNKAKDAIKTTSQSRPSFARFLESTAREHKGKLSLDNLLIKPVQKFPNYEMLFTRLIKHTDCDHPDQKPLQDVLKLVHDILVHINCKEKEVLENGQREATLRELEGVIEGVSELVIPERQFLVFDLVSMPSGQGARKERGFFLFNDLLVITSIKRRSGTIRKPNPAICPGSVASTLDTNKYKFLTKISIDQIEIVKSKDESIRKAVSEIEQLMEDCSKLQQIAEVAAMLRCPHQLLEETIRDLQRDIQRQLAERQTNDTQLNMLDLSINSTNGIQYISIVFCKQEKRSQWEEIFTEAKQKLAASLEHQPVPEFLASIPIRKTRAGLQFTCASPTISSQKDVWVCNSDGYVGQVCVLSLTPEPTVTSCNGVCNARILCVASVPANSDINTHSISSSDETPRSSRNSNSSNCHSTTNSSETKKTSTEKGDNGSDIQLDSNSSSDDSEIEGGNIERVPSPGLLGHHQHQDSNSDDPDGQQSTMWLGTEDGCIHVYNCTDNIRIKKNKIKIQHVSAVYSILYLDNRVFVALANGDICVYLRDNAGWNTSSPHCIPIGTVTSPVSKLLSVHGKLWCSIQGIIKVLDTKSLQIEHQIQISSDSKPITNMAVSHNFVWISIQNSAHIKCFHSNNYEFVFEVNLAPSVNKMLSNCDDIIRQHKAACLRVTSLLSCKDLIWIGTSAGVLLTIPAQGYSKGQTTNMPVVTGIPHGHTGHVRFLTFVETDRAGSSSSGNNGSDNESSSINYVPSAKNNRHSTHTKTKAEAGSAGGSKVLIISGGDGYEDFRSSGANTMSEVAGREDSTNHLLLWQM